MKKLLVLLLSLSIIACNQDANGGSTDETAAEKTSTSEAGASSGEAKSEAVYEKLKAAEFEEKISDEVIILDVRTPNEYASGHIEGAINIDIWGETFVDDVNKLDASKTVLVYCKSGGRSGNAAQILETGGFKTIYDLKGGISSWDREGLPTVQ